MSNNIDWSKAPEGATYYCPETDDEFAAWYKKVDGKWMVWTTHLLAGWRYTSWLPSDAIARPTGWDGTGLPPIGTICEFFVNGTMPGDSITRSFISGDKIEVISHKKAFGRLLPVVWNVRTETATTLNIRCIRPLKTQEQIAAEEREKECEAMLAIARSRHPNPDVCVTIRALYDAGYRKADPTGANQ